jgi:hypothetical protein
VGADLPNTAKPPLTRAVLAGILERLRTTHLVMRLPVWQTGGG